MTVSNERPIGKFKRYLDEEQGLCEIEITDPATIVYLLKLKNEGRIPAKKEDWNLKEIDK